MEKNCIAVHTAMVGCSLGHDVPRGRAHLQDFVARRQTVFAFSIANEKFKGF